MSGEGRVRGGAGEEEVDDPTEGGSGQQDSRIAGQQRLDSRTEQPLTQEASRLQLQQDKEGRRQQVPNKSVNFPFGVLLVGFQWAFSVLSGTCASRGRAAAGAPGDGGETPDEALQVV